MNDVQLGYFEEIRKIKEEKSFTWETACKAILQEKEDKEYKQVVPMFSLNEQAQFIEELISKIEKRELIPESYSKYSEITDYIFALSDELANKLGGYGTDFNGAITHKINYKQGCIIVLGHRIDLKGKSFEGTFVFYKPNYSNDIFDSRFITSSFQHTELLDRLFQVICSYSSLDFLVI